MITSVIFYVLDKAIRQYRHYAQGNIDQAGLDITIDQWLVLNVIQASPDLGQLEIARQVFKDQASVARIIELLVKKDLLIQESSQTDRRRVNRSLTPAGHTLLRSVAPIIANNRATALHGLSQPDIEQLRRTLEAIIDNCQPATKTGDD